jgi:WD40 repeat protein
MRQIRLVSSGVQTWYKHVIGAAGDMFAFCSTMAIHLFDSQSMSLKKMLVAHERTITCLVWHPHDPNQVAVSHLDGMIIIWNIEKEEPCFKYHIGETGGCCEQLDWSPTRPTDLYYATRDHHDGEAYVLDTANGPVANATTRLHKREKNTSVKVMRCHPTVTGRSVIGLSDGRLVLFENRNASKKLVFNQPKKNPNTVAIEDVQWDPLSTDYMLVCYQDGCLSLVDVARDVEIHQFDRQAQGITTMDWIRNQPGNFVTASDRMGAIKVWNVSQRSPIDQIKVGISG